MASQHRDTVKRRDTVQNPRSDLTARAHVTGTGGGASILRTTRSADEAQPVGGPAGWAPVTNLTAWCRTCGTEVEFTAPTGAAPADLAADERGCVWCGEALVLSSYPVPEPTATASAA